MRDTVRQKLQHEIQQIDQLYAVLIDYLSFRHFFRNSYAYQLEWDQMHPLVESITETWKELKTSLWQLLDEDDGPDEVTE